MGGSHGSPTVKPTRACGVKPAFAANAAVTIRQANKIARASRELLWVRWKAKVTKPQASWGAKPLKQDIAGNGGASIGNRLEGSYSGFESPPTGIVPLSEACRIQ